MDTPDYTRALLELLGDQDPTRVQEELLERLERAIGGIGEAQMRLAERPGKWSILEVIQHLADSEVVYGYRIRAILTEETPDLAAYDQDDWATTLEYNAGSPSEALDQLRAMRWANLRLIRTLDDVRLERSGVHEERGVESVRTIVALLAAHDLVHLRQIERIKAAHGLRAADQPPAPR